MNPYLSSADYQPFSSPCFVTWDNLLHLIHHNESDGGKVMANVSRVAAFLSWGNEMPLRFLIGKIEGRGGGSDKKNRSTEV